MMRKNKPLLMHCTRFIHCAILVSGISVFGSTVSHAAAVSSVQIDGISGGLVNQTSYTSGQTIGLSGTGVGIRGGTTSASAGAMASEGFLSLNVRSASTAVGGINSTTSSNASASARWNDEIYITSAALNGQAGYFIARLDFSGTGVGATTNLTNPQPGVGSTAQEAMTVSVSGLGYASSIYPTAWSLAIGDNGTANVTDFAPITDIDVKVDFTFGWYASVGYQLGAFLQSSTNTWYGPTTNTADGALDVSLRWAGITGVFLRDGTQVQDFGISSTSGFNYLGTATTVVPIPAAAWLLGPGLLGLIGVARRKRQ